MHAITSEEAASPCNQQQTPPSTNAGEADTAHHTPPLSDVAVEHAEPMTAAAQPTAHQARPAAYKAHQRPMPYAQQS